jgi:hypothetical protein
MQDNALPVVGTSPVGHGRNSSPSRAVSSAVASERSKPNEGTGSWTYSPGADSTRDVGASNAIADPVPRSPLGRSHEIRACSVGQPRLLIGQRGQVPRRLPHALPSIPRVVAWRSSRSRSCFVPQARRERYSRRAELDSRGTRPPGHLVDPTKRRRLPRRGGTVTGGLESVRACQHRPQYLHHTAPLAHWLAQQTMESGPSQYPL